MRLVWDKIHQTDAHLPKLSTPQSFFSAKFWPKRRSDYSCRLPLELCHMIMEHLVSSKPNEAYPLLFICKTWLPYATTLLYYRVEPLSAKTLVHLVERFERNPELARSIRILTFPLLIVSNYDVMTGLTKCP